MHRCGGSRRRDAARSLAANHARRSTFAANDVCAATRARRRPRAAETPFAASDLRSISVR